MDDIILALSGEFLHKPIWMWGTFIMLVLGLLVLDLGVFHKKDHEIEVKESLLLSGFYISIGLLFGGWVWYSLGSTKGIEYLTGFVVEKTLAMDNIFVIAMIFAYFQIPRLYQHRVLFWGILGVIVLRGLMIGFGAALVHNFEWILYVFAAFLVFTGIKMLIVECYQLMEGLANLRPKLLQELLESCKSVKVKRLFMYMADKAGHQWRTFLDTDRFDLGTGDRAIVKGGIYVSKFKISIPEELANL